MTDLPSAPDHRLREALPPIRAFLVAVASESGPRGDTARLLYQRLDRAVLSEATSSSEPDLDVDKGRCTERCLGIAGHPGFHQTSDYSDIIRERPVLGVDVLAAALATPEFRAAFEKPYGLATDSARALLAILSASQTQEPDIK